MALSPGEPKGLAIAHHLVHMYGGEIDIRSQLGQGTTSIVRLPIEAEDKKLLSL